MLPRSTSSAAIRWILGVLGAIAGLAVLSYVLAWILAPRLPNQVVPRSSADIAAMQALKAPFDVGHPLRVQREVDYALGQTAPWWPKAEAPVLADLVAQGKLPPAAERTGPEPVVVDPIDGPGCYGGTTVTPNGSPDALGRTAAINLLRWSPQGAPLAPCLARTWSMSADGYEFTCTLRRGLRWSDGEPVSTADVRYWWEDELGCAELGLPTPDICKVKGQRAKFTFEPDGLTFRIRFAHPHSRFPYLLATPRGSSILSTPAHYLRRYHPIHGDQALIAGEKAARGLTRTADLYRKIKEATNPEHPRLWPWLYRHHQPNPPYTFVRNPYFFMVDSQGNQLPYLDRILAPKVNAEHVVAQICAGQIPVGLVRRDDAILMIENRDRGGYEVRRWLRADRSDAMVHFNLNRRVDPTDPSSALKARLLAETRFRQAMSLAIDRREIIEAVFSGDTVPAQVSPGPQSPFSHPRSFSAFTDFDPVRANQLLDTIGLTGRDGEGMRTFADGTRMQFFLDIPMWFAPNIAQFLCEHWRGVGVRVIARLRYGGLFYTEKSNLQHDLLGFTGNNEHFPLIEPRCVLPLSEESNFAIGWARWYQRGGMQNHPAAVGSGAIAPPAGHPIRTALALWDQVGATTDFAEQKRLIDGIHDIAAEQVWTVAVGTSSDSFVAIRKDFRGVPARAVTSFDYAGNTWPEQQSFRSPPAMATDDRERLGIELTTTTPDHNTAAGSVATQRRATWGGRLLSWSLWGIGAALLAMICLRHPFVLRRLVIMVPTLLAISLVVFTIIEAPPGDYLSAKIMLLESQGERANIQQITQMRSQFHLDDPLPMRYIRWMGLPWFLSFDSKDAGLIQGNLGRSMENSEEVGRLLGDKILLTFILSLGTVLVTWLIAVPLGLYSAVRQYSIGDHTLTLLVFIGNCIPSFLLALVLMYVAQIWLGIPVVGLFSPEYAAVQGWPWGKVVDLLAHLWLPVVILSLTGTAGLIRTLRANLLDELRKPYVTTARAKGVRPLKLLLKYPLRVALNPFISGIGGLFPFLVSGGALISIVLSLPTVGPEMINSLMNKDSQFAGSCLMVLSTLGVLGTLISDLLLLWLDPRIRLEGASR